MARINSLAILLFWLIESLRMANQRFVHVISADAGRRKVLQRLLRAVGLTAVIYETAGAALEAAPRLRAGCLLVDLATPGLDGSALQTQLRALGVTLPVIATAPKTDVTTVVKTMKAGAADFIEGPLDDQRLLAAIEAVLLDPRNEASAGETVQAARRLAVLSNRERQVLGEIVAGQPNKVIAHKLAISMRTVEVHRARLLRRLGLRSIAEAISLSALAAVTSLEGNDEDMS
jgi:two-component system response regulator FixJ